MFKHYSHTIFYIEEKFRLDRLQGDPEFPTPSPMHVDSFDVPI